MKVILSRKGFDSVAGGKASPHFVENGRLLSLPIPEENDSNSIDTGRTYADLRFDDGSTYLDIIKQLGLNDFDNKYVHLDPDINPLVLNNRHTNWIGMFGQSSSSQSHLHNKGVGKGDLFLFFGWFRDVHKTQNKYAYIPGTNRHIIWGYLQVDEVQYIVPTKKYEDWKAGHPHYYYRKRDNNVGYIARKELSFAPGIPGYGTFNYKNSLVLTCPGQKKRSIWRLPRCFHPKCGTTMSYHENNKLWELFDNYCTLNSVGRGQEFVIEGNEEVIKWAKQLFAGV